MSTKAKKIGLFGLLLVTIVAVTYLQKKHTEGTLERKIATKDFLLNYFEYRTLTIDRVAKKGQLSGWPFRRIM